MSKCGELSVVHCISNLVQLADSLRAGGCQLNIKATIYHCSLFVQQSSTCIFFICSFVAVMLRSVLIQVQAESHSDKIIKLVLLWHQERRKVND